MTKFKTNLHVYQKDSWFHRIYKDRYGTTRQLVEAETLYVDTDHGDYRFGRVILHPNEEAARIACGNDEKAAPVTPPPPPALAGKTKHKYAPGTVLRLSRHDGRTFHVVVLPHQCGCCYQLLDLFNDAFTNKLATSRVIHEWDRENVEANSVEWKQSQSGRVRDAYCRDEDFSA